MDANTQNGMSIDYAAECIFSCVMDRSETDEYILTSNPKIYLGLLLRYLCPDAVFWFLKLK